MTALLLDTCAIIFIAENQAIDPLARQEVTAAGGSGGVLVSPISAWEIGLLATKRGFAFFPNPKAWFQSFMLNPGVRLTPYQFKTSTPRSPRQLPRERLSGMERQMRRNYHPP